MSRKQAGPHEVARWNIKNPVGTAVLYWPYMRVGRSMVARTRLPARILSNGDAVVWVKDREEPIRLFNVDVMAPELAAVTP